MSYQPLGPRVSYHLEKAPQGENRNGTSPNENGSLCVSSYKDDGKTPKTTLYLQLTNRKASVASFHQIQPSGDVFIF